MTQPPMTPRPTLGPWIQSKPKASNSGVSIALGVVGARPCPSRARQSRGRGYGVLGASAHPHRGVLPRLGPAWANRELYVARGLFVPPRKPTCHALRAPALGSPIAHELEPAASLTPHEDHAPPALVAHGGIGS